MNILYINHYAGSKRYGMEFRPYFFARELKNMGHNVIMLAASFSHLRERNPVVEKNLDESDIDGINYSWIKTVEYTGNGIKKIINMLQFMFIIFLNTGKIGRKYKSDIVIVSSPHPLAVVAAIYLAKKYRCQLIVEIRDLWPETFVAYDIVKKNNPILKLLYVGEKWIYKKADKLIFTMEGGKDYIIEKGWNKENGGPVDLNKIHHINNGVDLEEFEYNKEQYTIKDEDLTNDNFYKIIYTGSLRQANTSVWKLIEAAELFKEKGYSDIRFLIYGDGGEREMMEDYCKKKNLDNIRIKGYVNKKYIPYILSRCDLNILNCSSRDVLKYGGSQNKLFEYLASGHPIISGETSKYSIVNNYNCGISKKYEDTKDLVKAILQIKNLDDESKILMNENILKTAQEYEYSNLTQKLIRIIEESEQKNGENNNLNTAY